MHRISKELGLGPLAGAAGLVAMEIVRRATQPLVAKRAREPQDAATRSARTMSPLGPQHEPDEGATAAVGRIAYEKVAGKHPSPRTKSALSWAVHIAYGLLVASAYSVVRGRCTAHPIRDGVLFGSGLWLAGDELAVPLLGLTDKPTAYHTTHHVQSLAQHLGFGIATAATARALQR